MSRLQRRKPWYKTPGGICGIYVGCKVAQEIYERDITLEEYLGRTEH